MTERQLRFPAQPGDLIILHYHHPWRVALVISAKNTKPWNGKTTTSFISQFITYIHAGDICDDVLTPATSAQTLARLDI